MSNNGFWTVLGGFIAVGCLLAIPVAGVQYAFGWGPFNPTTIAQQQADVRSRWVERCYAWDMNPLRSRDAKVARCAEEWSYRQAQRAEGWERRNAQP